MPKNWSMAPKNLLFAPSRFILDSSPPYSLPWSLNQVEHANSSLPSSSKQNRASLYDSFSFWFLQSCPLFSPSCLAVVTVLLLLAPGSCTLHCAHIFAITPFVNNPSPNYPTVRVPAIAHCDTHFQMPIVHEEILRHLSFSLVPGCQIDLNLIAVRLLPNQWDLWPREGALAQRDKISKCQIRALER